MVFSSFARTVFLCLTQVFRFFWQINSKWISHSKIYCCRTIEESDEKTALLVYVFTVIFFSMVSLSHFLFFTLFLSVFFSVQIGSVRFRRTRCVFVCWSVFHSLFVCVYFYSHLCGISWSKWSENQQQLHQQIVQQHTWVFYRALTRDKQNESHDTNVKS